MKTEEEILQNCLSSLKKIISILKTEVANINQKCNSKNEVETDRVEELMRTSILYTKKSYLEYFVKISEFLCKKLGTNTEKEDFYFYVPWLRTLIEIYAKLLYLPSQNTDQQMTLVAVNTLSSLANLSGKSSEIQAEYEKQYLLYKPFFDRKKIIIPSISKEMNKEWLWKNKSLQYPDVASMLNNKLIQVSSPQIYEKSKSQENPYVIYRHLSNYVHGNLLSASHHGNEKFWIISETFTCSAYVAELVSNKILNGSKRTEITKWIKEADKTYSDFRNLWIAKYQ